MIKTVFFIAIIAFIPDGCSHGEFPQEETCVGDNCDLLFDSFERTVGIGGTWHDRYIQDNCARCPECCVQITEDGFIDEYGVERPFDWLPPEEDSGCGEGQDGDPCPGTGCPDDEGFCSDFECPGDECPCVQDDAGNWWVNATLGE